MSSKQRTKKRNLVILRRECPVCEEHTPTSIVEVGGNEVWTCQKCSNRRRYRVR
jgi:ribosomal protein L37AE/L43A